MTFGDGVALGTLIVLSVTLVAVLWYVWETRSLARATKRMGEASLRPVLTVWMPPPLRSLSTNMLRFEYRNIGNGPALNIQWTLGNDRDDRLSMGTDEVNGIVELRVAHPPALTLSAAYDDAHGKRWYTSLEIVARDAVFDNGTALFS